MARDVYAKVQFNDAGNYPVERRFLLATQMQDDGSNMAAILTQLTALIAAIQAICWDNLEPATLEIVIPQGGAAANAAANNDTEAFCRYVDDVTGKVAHLSIPAWDDALFDKLPNNAMSAAFNTLAAVIDPLTRNPETGNAWTFQAAQSRGLRRALRANKI
jgi:hypothetical protein